MNISKHTSRIYKWFTQPKKFKITLMVSVQDRYFFEDLEIVAKNRKEAVLLANNQIVDKIEIKPIKVNSLGRVKIFEEIK